MTGIVKTLDEAAIANAESQASNITASSASGSNDFVFFAAFDGTNNSEDPATSGTTQTTSVRKLYEMAQAGASSSHVQAFYAPGVGTPGSEPGSSAVPTSQTIANAEGAYAEFVATAQRWLAIHPDAKISAMVTSFSRGGGAAAIFSQLLYEKGLVTPEGKTLIPAGKEGIISAALIMDPVLTGLAGNMAFAPIVKNLTVVRAENEYRKAFRAVDYADPNVRYVSVPGNHGDVGGFYDNGLGAIYLSKYRNFFSGAGISMSEVPATRQFDHNSPVTIHSESIAGKGQIVPLWSAITDDSSSPRVTTRFGYSVSRNGSATRFVDYKGDLVFGGTGTDEGVEDKQVYILPGAQAKVSGTGLTVWAWQNSDTEIVSTAQVTSDSGTPISTDYGPLVSGKPSKVIGSEGAKIKATGANLTVFAEKVASAEMDIGERSELRTAFDTIYELQTVKWDSLDVENVLDDNGNLVSGIMKTSRKDGAIKSVYDYVYDGDESMRWEERGKVYEEIRRRDGSSSFTDGGGMEFVVNADGSATVTRAYGGEIKSWGVNSDGTLWGSDYRGNDDLSNFSVPEGMVAKFVENGIGLISAVPGETYNLIGNLDTKVETIDGVKIETEFVSPTPISLPYSLSNTPKRITRTAPDGTITVEEYRLFADHQQYKSPYHVTITGADGTFEDLVIAPEELLLRSNHSLSDGSLPEQTSDGSAYYADAGGNKHVFIGAQSEQNRYVEATNVHVENVALERVVGETTFDRAGNVVKTTLVSAGITRSETVYDNPYNYTTTTHNDNGEIELRVEGGQKASAKWKSSAGEYGTIIYLPDGRVNEEWLDAEGNVYINKSSANGAYSQTKAASNGDLLEEWWKDANGNEGHYDCTMTRNDDGTYSIERNNGAGYIVIGQYDGNARLTSEKWTRADWTSGENQYFVDGSKIAIMTDMFGFRRAKEFDSEGRLRGATWVARDGSTGDTIYSEDGSFSDRFAQGTGRFKVRRYDANGKFIEAGIDASGSDNDDTVMGDYGNDMLLGGRGVDRLFGFGSADTIIGGAGDDVLDGGSGNDVYIYNIGDGNDDITFGTEYEKDTLRFGVGIKPGAVNYRRLGDSLQLTLKYEENTSELIIRGWFANAPDLPTDRSPAIEFADGTRWTQSDTSINVQSATEDDDDLTADNEGMTLFGQGGADTLRSGSGNDRLSGGAGQDTYIFERGFGNDTIDAGGADGRGDVIRFGDSIRAEDVSISAERNGLRLHIAGTGDSVFVASWQLGGKFALDRIEFSDGVVWDTDDINSMRNIVDGTGNDDWLFGTELKDSISGFSGNDNLMGFDEDDIISGGLGHDTLDGGSGNDSLLGGEGDDFLAGGSGADEYTYGLGDGSDTIEESNEVGAVDILKFDKSITPGDVTISYSEDAIELSIIGGGSVKIRNWLNENSRVDRIEFANGTTWTAQEIEQNMRVASTGDDRIFGTSAADLLAGLDGGDLLVGMDGDDTLAGGKGNDRLKGGRGEDVYQFSRGDGVDIVEHVKRGGGAGDTLRFDSSITSDEVTVTRSGASLVLSIAGSLDSVTLQDWFGDEYTGADGYDQVVRVEFASGVTWTSNDLITMSLTGTDIADHLIGSSADDVIRGHGGEDTLEGGEGDDLLNGGTGNDHLDGGYGSDRYVFNRGDGEDTISSWSEGWGHDSIDFGESIVPSDVAVEASGFDLRLSIAGGNDSIVLVDFFSRDSNGNMREGTINFVDGTAWDTRAVLDKLPAAAASGENDSVIIYNSIAYHSLGGDDDIKALGESNIDAGDGDDRIEILGGAGSVVRGGSGNDTVTFNASQADVLYGQEGNDQVVAESANHSLFDGGDGDDTFEIEFSRENSMQLGYGDDNVAIGFSINDVIDAGSGSDHISITQAYASILDGGGESDEIDVRAGVALLYGGASDDKLQGGYGSQILIGGKGNDIVNGGIGSDVILFNRGDGHDTVEKGSTFNGTLSLGGGVNYAQIVFVKNNADLVLRIDDSDSVTFSDWFSSNSYNAGDTTLQFVLSAESGYDESSDDMLFNRRVQQFNFRAIVADFEQALEDDASLSAWSLSDELLRHHLLSTDEFAAGGAISLNYADQSAAPAASSLLIQRALADDGFGERRQRISTAGGGDIL